MLRDSQTLTTYLEIVDQKRRYQRHMRLIQEATPSIDTSPIPMNPSIAEKQQQNAINRVYKFQLEEDKLRFVNELHELNKKKKKSFNPKGGSSRRKKDNNLQSLKSPTSQIESTSANPQNADISFEPSALIGISSSRKPRKPQRKYPKLLEPMTPKKTRKIPMAIQTSNLSDQIDNYPSSSAIPDESNQFSDDRNDNYRKSKQQSNRHQSSNVDIPMVYSGYLNEGEFSISVDEKRAFCYEEKFDKVDNENLTENNNLCQSEDQNSNSTKENPQDQ